MTFQGFVEDVKDNILSYLPMKYADSSVEVNEVLKNNGVKLQGLMIHGVKNVSPTIYLEPFYEMHSHGIGMHQIMKSIADVYVKHQENVSEFSTGALTYENLKDKLFITAVNAEKNEHLLKDVPHEIKEDLALIYRVQLPLEAEGGKGSFILHNSHLQYFGITEETLAEQAKVSTRNLMEPKVTGMFALLEEMESYNPILQIMSEEEKANLKANENMFVVTTQDKVFGAAFMFDENVMHQMAERIGGNFAVIPSSIHEIICLKEQGEFDFDCLRDMVKEVNYTQVMEEEQLADSIYYYDAEKQALSLVEEGTQTMGMDMNQ